MYSYNSRFKTPTTNRGQHSNNNFFGSFPQPRYTHYGQTNSSQQHNYYRQMNAPQHDYGQTSGYQQRSYPSHHSLRNQNSNHSHREKTIPNEEDYKFCICPGCLHHFDFIRMYYFTNSLLFRDLVFSY